jgi:hypothetical protein
MEVLYCALGNLAGHHWVKGSSGHFCSGPCESPSEKSRWMPPGVISRVLFQDRRQQQTKGRSRESTRKTASLFELLTEVVHYLPELGQFPFQVGHFVFELR